MFLKFFRLATRAFSTASRIGICISLSSFPQLCLGCQWFLKFSSNRTFHQVLTIVRSRTSFVYYGSFLVKTVRALHWKNFEPNQIGLGHLHHVHLFGIFTTRVVASTNSSLSMPFHHLKRLSMIYQPIYIVSTFIACAEILLSIMSATTVWNHCTQSTRC
jgi:hypothetical protein